MSGSVRLRRKKRGYISLVKRVHARVLPKQADQSLPSCQVLFDDSGHRVPGTGLNLHQQRLARFGQFKALTQVRLDALKQRRGPLGVCQGAVRAATVVAQVQTDLRRRILRAFVGRGLPTSTVASRLTPVCALRRTTVQRWSGCCATAPALCYGSSPQRGC